MIGDPWNIVLTIIFSITLVICLVEIFKHRKDSPTGKPGTGEIVHIGHAVMSVAMIAMTWSMENQTLMWVQVAIFLALALWLVPSLLASQGRDRIDVISHLVLHAAMIWMLAAMELLMAEMANMNQDNDMDMGSDSSMDMSMPAMADTPLWADVVNWVFVVASALVGLWWLKRFIETRSIHALCHTLMGGGMALMLVLMNT